MNFDIDYRDHHGRDVNHYGGGDWDYDWTERHSYHYNGARIVTDGYSDVSLFPGEAEVELGDDIHIVYVSYDTGDSFGREYGCRTHLWAFSDRKRARRLVDAIIEDHRAKPDYDFDNKPLMFEGVPINTNEWKGHFEHFNDADIQTVEVKKSR